MSLTDEITGGEIYNPYIRIYAPNKKYYLTMNSASFGDKGQENLIFPGEIESILEIKEKKYFPVKAVIAEQIRIGHKRPQILGQVLSEILLGYLPEHIVDEYFAPKLENVLLNCFK
ncbi:MAG: hypothetical protein KJ646_02720 [Nanoarchaeota archaeon]|nr:hypothetical protein [Nanoarchaeota archaeon]MBU4116427.1 hypothetical protein [Nanoarchaeota archaeon]